MKTYTRKWKYLTQHWMKNLNYLMNHILHQIFKVTLNVSLKEITTDNFLVQICILKS